MGRSWRSFVRTGPTRSHLPGSIDGSQATWSADGRRLAWSTIRPSGTPAVAVAAVGPTPTTSKPVSFPSTSHGAHPARTLRCSETEPSGTIEFALIEPEKDAVRTVDGGAPFYFDWSPDGAQIVAHVGESELRVIDVETGSRIRSVPTTGEFQAPQWTDEGIVYQDSTPSAIRARGLAVQGSTTQRLLVGTIDASDREITRFDGFGAFAATTDRVAYLTGSGLDLWIVETGAAPIKVNDGAVLAFQWSPDGTKLLSLEFDRDSEVPAARWVVWADDEVRRFAEFEPTGVWTERYLPFWDQYNRSLSIWSPDGEAFVYSATSGTGPSEIFVQVVSRGRCAGPRGMSGTSPAGRADHPDASIRRASFGEWNS